MCASRKEAFSFPPVKCTINYFNWTQTRVSWRSISCYVESWAHLLTAYRTRRMWLNAKNCEYHIEKERILFSTHIKAKWIRDQRSIKRSRNFIMKPDIKAKIYIVIASSKLKWGGRRRLFCSLVARNFCHFRVNIFMWRYEWNLKFEFSLWRKSFIAATYADFCHMRKALSQSFFFPLSLFEVNSDIFPVVEALQPFNEARRRIVKFNFWAILGRNVMENNTKVSWGYLEENFWSLTSSDLSFARAQKNVKSFNHMSWDDSSLTCKLIKKPKALLSITLCGKTN